MFLFDTIFLLTRMLVRRNLEPRSVIPVEWFTPKQNLLMKPLMQNSTRASSMPSNFLSVNIQWVYLLHVHPLETYLYCSAKKILNVKYWKLIKIMKPGYWFHIIISALRNCCDIMMLIFLKKLKIVFLC